MPRTRCGQYGIMTQKIVKQPRVFAAAAPDYDEHGCVGLDENGKVVYKLGREKNEESAAMGE